MFSLLMSIWVSVMVGFLLTLFTSVKSVKNFLMMVVLITFMSVVTVSYYTSGWLAAIFFLVYMGGLLMLFFYMITLSSKTLDFHLKPSLISVIMLFQCFSVPFSQKTNNFSDFLMNSWELSLICCLVFILLMMLWIINKFLSNMLTAVRPFY